MSELAADAEALGCEQGLGQVIRIGEQGSNAERQEDTYRETMLDGASERYALRAVVDLIIAETECMGGEAQGAPDSSP